VCCTLGEGAPPKEHVSRTYPSYQTCIGRLPLSAVKKRGGDGTRPGVVVGRCLDSFENLEERESAAMSCGGREENERKKIGRRKEERTKKTSWVSGVQLVLVVLFCLGESRRNYSEALSKQHLVNATGHSLLLTVCGPTGGGAEMHLPHQVGPP